MVGFAFACCGICGFGLICLFGLFVFVFVFNVGVGFGGFAVSVVWYLCWVGVFVVVCV